MVNGVESGTQKLQMSLIFLLIKGTLGFRCLVTTWLICNTAQSSFQRVHKLYIFTGCITARTFMTFSPKHFADICVLWDSHRMSKYN